MCYVAGCVCVCMSVCMCVRERERCGRLLMPQNTLIPNRFWDHTYGSIEIKKRRTSKFVSLVIRLLLLLMKLWQVMQRLYNILLLLPNLLFPSEFWQQQQQQLLNFTFCENFGLFFPFLKQILSLSLSLSLSLTLSFILN